MPGTLGDWDVGALRGGFYVPSVSFANNHFFIAFLVYLYVCVYILL